MGGGNACRQRDQKERKGGVKKTPPTPPSPPTCLDLTCRWKRRETYVTKVSTQVPDVNLIPVQRRLRSPNRPSKSKAHRGTAGSGRSTRKGKKTWRKRCFPMWSQSSRRRCTRRWSRPPHGIFAFRVVLEISTRKPIPAPPGAMPRVLIYLTACN